jgi:hypothetical protein
MIRQSFNNRQATAFEKKTIAFIAVCPAAACIFALQSAILPTTT